MYENMQKLVLDATQGRVLFSICLDFFVEYKFCHFLLPLQAQQFGQQEHFPPQRDLPFFLSEYILYIAAKIIAETINPIITVTIFKPSLFCLI